MSISFTFNEVRIKQEAVVAVMEVKNLLLKNSISALEGFIAAEAGKYIGKYLDQAILFGDGLSFEGIIPGLIDL